MSNPSIPGHGAVVASPLARDETRTVAGTCVAIEGHGVLLQGASGAGKSDLALRLIEEGAVLVADDQTGLGREGDGLRAFAPSAIAGLLEVRGLGILRLPTASSAALACVVSLVASRDIVRLPSDERIRLCGIDLPHFRLDPFQASATAKVRLAVRIATGGIMRLP